MWRQTLRGPHPARWVARSAAVIALGAGILLTAALPASAHAVLVSSTPAAGARVGTTPSVVTLTFDEPLVPRLSRCDVTDPAGRTFAGAVSGKTMRVRLTTNAPGVYDVDWKTVSRVDGHTITGGFRFGVGVSPATATSPSAPGPTTGDVVLAIFRGIEYALLLLACGAAVLRALGREVELRQPATGIAVALLASGVVVVAVEAVVASSGASPLGVAEYLANGLTGWARVARLVLEAALLAVALLLRRLSPVLLAAIVGAVAVAGHGADVEPAWQGMAVNAGHLAAAGVWAGGILAMAYLHLRGRWSTVRAVVLPRFSRVALWAFTVSVVLGAVQAAQLLGSPSPVLSTSYGLTLIAKSVGIAAMVPLSLLAWRRVRVHVRAEAMVGLVVIAAAAALSAYPVVPKEAAEQAERPPAGAHRLSPFPRPGDLTMGGRAGSVMVGLSVHPGRPGRNTVHVYLAAPATRAAQARIRAGTGGWRALAPCGPSCRTGTALLNGAEHLAVAVAGPSGGTASFDLPRLPAPDGSALVRAAATRMDRLGTYRVSEVLSGIHSDYVYARPHRMYLRTWFGGHAQGTLWLGPSVYRRSDERAPWRLQSKGALAPVPYFPWNPFRPFVDAHVVGTARVGGTTTTVVSVFGGHGADPTAVWFTLYVDRATDRVLSARMWAPNHFMNDRYYAFDRPVRIPSPAQARP